MAVILNLEHQKETPHYLHAYHCIGRSGLHVDTIIDAVEISRTHAVIEWREQQWFIRDISTNGTWIKQQKLMKDQWHKLNVGDELYFAKGDSHGFVVKDLTPPQNMLRAIDSSKIETTQSDSPHYITEIPPIILSASNELPLKQSSEIVLFYAQSQNQWYKGHLDDPEGAIHCVVSGAKIRFAHQDWQLTLNTPSEKTTSLAKVKLSAQQIHYRFNLSQGGDNVELNIKVNGEDFCLSNRIYHHLTLNLANHREDDTKAGKDEHEQGWRSPDQIIKELDCDMTHFNTHVYRARKQLIEILGGACDGDALIERKGKKIRFAGSAYYIYEGNKLIVNHEPNRVLLKVLHG